MKQRDTIREEIAREAYALYEKRGMTHGADLDDWLQAEKFVLEKYAKPDEKKGKAIRKRV